jgi:hypothetical protein
MLREFYDDLIKHLAQALGSSLATSEVAQAYLWHTCIYNSSEASFATITWVINAYSNFVELSPRTVLTFILLELICLRVQSRRQQRR